MFVALLRRDVLIVPFILNKFIRASYNDSVAKCQSDVEDFVGLLPAIASSWRRGWCSSIVATDVSEHGFGVCLKECKTDVCEAIGRTSERARFRERHPDTSSARTAFLDHHRLVFDSRGDLIDLDENEDETTETLLIPTEGFPEVPFEVVEASGWVDVAAGRWGYRDESIVVLESRALTRGVEILAIAQQLNRKRCVALVNNMAAAEITQFLGDDMFS